MGTRAATAIHADGGPASGRGLTVLEPGADGPNDKVIRSGPRQVGSQETCADPLAFWK